MCKLPVVLQVFPVWHRVSGGRKDSGDERPLCDGEEAGILRHHRGDGPHSAWPLHLAQHVFLHHQKEPHRVHQRNPTGSAHLAGHILQVKSLTTWKNMGLISFLVILKMYISQMLLFPAQ